MNSVVKFVTAAWHNKHTSGSAIVLFVATAAGVIWPKYKGQVDEIARAAIVYGLIAAGDARAMPPADKPLTGQIK